MQILLDPYYRTIRGLCSLIAKEWASFGFKFHERQGHANRKNDTDGDCSPIFVQWLDSLWQLVRLFPGAFEYNTRALLLIAHHSYSCRFGTFLFDCERHRHEGRLPYKTQSLWGYMLHPSRVGALVNTSYDPGRGDVLLPHPAAILRSVDVWGDWFLRWAPFPSLVVTVSRLERYPPAGYEHARVRQACVVGTPIVPYTGPGTSSVTAAAATASSAPGVSAGAPSVGGGGATGVPASASASASAPTGNVDPLTGLPLPSEEAEPVQKHAPIASARASSLSSTASITQAGTLLAGIEGEVDGVHRAALSSLLQSPQAVGTTSSEAAVGAALAALASEQGAEGRASPALERAAADVMSAAGLGPVALAESGEEGEGEASRSARRSSASGGLGASASARAACAADDEGDERRTTSPAPEDEDGEGKEKDEPEGQAAASEASGEKDDAGAPAEPVAEESPVVVD